MNNKNSGHRIIPNINVSRASKVNIRLKVLTVFCTLLITVSGIAQNSDDIVITNSVDEAIETADVIYTDTWTSMGQEDEAVARRAKFAGFQVNSELLEKAPDHTVVMHSVRRAVRE